MLVRRLKPRERDSTPPLGLCQQPQKAATMITPASAQQAGLLAILEYEAEASDGNEWKQRYLSNFEQGSREFATAGYPFWRLSSEKHVEGLRRDRGQGL